MDLAKLKDLPAYGFWYLATPYSLYEEGLEQAYKDACLGAAKLLEAGVPVFSPIAHVHSISKFSSIDKRHFIFWMWADEPFIRLASGLLVLKLPGWQESTGVTEEIRIFADSKRRVEYLEWPLTL